MSHAEVAPSAVFVEAGAAERAVYSATVGVAWPWQWQRMSAFGDWTGRTELFLSQWNARTLSGERRSVWQFALVPLLRLRFDEGRSDWFVEGGIGISAMDRRYQSGDKQFSTRFNFVDTLALGVSLGTHRRNELSLRVTHVSNAGIRHPNPGENFVQLRYAHTY